MITDFCPSQTQKYSSSSGVCLLSSLPKKLPTKMTIFTTHKQNHRELKSTKRGGMAPPKQPTLTLKARTELAQANPYGGGASRLIPPVTVEEEKIMTTPMRTKTFRRNNSQLVH